MKQTAYLLLLVFAFAFTACNNATQQTGGAARDSSASHGSSGPANPNTTAPAGFSTSGSDTTKTNSSGVADPTIDSGQRDQ